jgi:hypothetical protein
MVRRTLGSLLPSVALALVFAACGQTPPGDGGDDASVPDASAGTDGAPTPTDAGRGDALTDAGADGPASPDGSTGELEIAVDVATLFEDCMPIVAPDPVTVQGTLSIKNKGASPAGPLVFAEAAVYDATGATRVATFKVDTTTQPIPAGGKVDTVFEKQVDTLAPKGGCATVACNADYVVELAFSGPGAPPGARARAKPKKMTCAF